MSAEHRRTISRREFLRLAVSIATGAALTACGGTPTPMPTLTSEGSTEAGRSTGQGVSVGQTSPETAVVRRQLVKPNTPTGIPDATRPATSIPTRGPATKTAVSSKESPTDGRRVTTTPCVQTKESAANIKIDSSMSLADALKQNPNSICPEAVLKRQKLVTVKYWSFDNQVHQGQIVIDQDLAQDIEKLFDLMLKNHFPISSVIPISDAKFKWNDELSMEANNTSGFNYRTIAGTNTLSNHAYGRAIDLNPLTNPYVKGSFIDPPGAKYNPSIPGTVTSDGWVVSFLKSRGWSWGGDWGSEKDYQHFEKPFVFPDDFTSKASDFYGE